jgi:hypothetical protein
MKASNFQQKPTPFTPKPLSVEQESAVDLLLTGKSDREVGEMVGVSRWTIQQWRTGHPVFMNTLQQRRAEVWGTTGERLRSLMSKAVDNLATAIEGGSLKASIELLKVTGMYGGVVNVLGDTDPEKIIRTMAAAQVQREGIPRDATHEALIRLTENTRYHERLQEIAAELRRDYGEDGEGTRDVDGRG